MKKYFVIIIIIILSFNIKTIVFADDCGDVVNCPKKLRPYYFCNNNNQIMALCAYDPFGIPYDEWFPKFKNVLKFNNNALPLCLEFDNSGPDIIRGKICGNGQCHTGDIYLKSDFIIDMKKAEQQWKCICGWDENDCGCTVKIGFVDVNQFQFSDPATQYSSNSVWNQFFDNTKDKEYFDPELCDGKHIYPYGPVTRNSCEINCNDIHIYLNNTKAYTKRDETEPNLL